MAEQKKTPSPFSAAAYPALRRALIFIPSDEDCDNRRAD
jgi:hypothetical protein